MGLSEVDIKAEGELEEGETTIKRLQHPTLQQSDIQQNSDIGDDTQIIHIEGTDENDPNMVVASMLPMTTLNMEDPATYVALAQLTQAAIESAPMDESGNVILMSYEDIHKSMQEIQATQQQQQQHQEQQDQQELSLHDIQIAQQQQQNDGSSNLDTVHQQQHHQHQQTDGTEEYVQVQIDNNAAVMTTTDPNMAVIENQVDLNVQTS